MFERKNQGNWPGFGEIITECVNRAVMLSV